MLGIDFETYCDLDLKVVGLDNYLRHHSFTPLCASIYSTTPGTRARKDFDLIAGTQERVRLLQWLEKEVLAPFNAGFERGCLRHLTGIKAPEPLPWKFKDAAVVARINGAGNSLDKAAAQLLGETKLTDGSRLIKKFCTPEGIKALGHEKPGPWMLDDPDWPLFLDYCYQDARLGHQIVDHADIHYPWAAAEHQALTDEMNEVGWPIAIDEVEAFLEISEENKEQALERFRQEHDPKGELNLGSFKQLQEWCKARKINSKSFDEANVTSMLKKIDKQLETKGPSQNLIEVKAMLETKQILGGSALKKLPVMLDRTASDGRLRHQYMHAGAGQTSRATGVGVQMQNLTRLSDPRPMSELLDRENPVSNDVLGANMRQLFRASEPEGRIIVGDFSAVESRDLAWQAGEEWKLQAYRDGRGIYEELAARHFNISYEAVTKPQRTFGKVGELSCGYGAGPSAVHRFAQKMNAPLTELEAAELVSGWRSSCANTVEHWAKLDDALHQALGDPGNSVWVPIGGEIGRIAGSGVSILASPTLPSITAIHPGALDLTVSVFDHSISFARVFRGCFRKGRSIVYHKSTKTKGGPLWAHGWKNPALSNRWSDYTIYGGKLTGILVQSHARELFYRALSRTKKAMSRYEVDVIGQFHDEIVLEWLPSKATIEVEEAAVLLRSCMTSVTLPGFPLDADVKFDYRYIK